MREKMKGGKRKSFNEEKAERKGLKEKKSKQGN